MSNKPRLVKCSVCGVEFELGYTTYLNRIKKQPVDTKFYCPEHKNFGRSEDKKAANAALSDEERERRRKAQSERTKKQWESYDDVKSVTPGQACVFYQDEKCLGGGIIKEVRYNNEKLWYLL